METVVSWENNRVFSASELKEIGIDKFGFISTDQIVFSEEIRKLCEGNICRQFGKTWACPPAVGTLEQCRDRCLAFDRAMVFLAGYTLEDSFDYEGMINGHSEFKSVCDRLYQYTKSKLPQFLLLSNEGCIRCKECTYPDSPCIFPDRLFPSLEGFGLYVDKLAEAAHLNYTYGENRVTYYGMLLF